MLDEEPRNIAAITDFLLVFECHCSIPLWENLNQIAVLQTSGSDDHDFFA